MMLIKMLGTLNVITVTGRDLPMNWPRANIFHLGISRKYFVQTAINILGLFSMVQVPLKLPGVRRTLQLAF